MYWNYLKYVMRHKWFVLLACIELDILFRGLVHDMSKFSLSEWKAYVDNFFGPYGSNKLGVGAEAQAKQTKVNKAFKVAWAHHIHMNPHHWESWIIPGKEECLEIPEVYCREMVADWQAMSRARGKADCRGWYESQKEVIKLHPTSRQLIESLIYTRKANTNGFET